MNIEIVESKFVQPRHVRTLPSWLTAVGTSLSSESQENRGNNCSKFSTNSSGLPAMSEVTSCDNAVGIPSSSKNTVDTDHQPKVEKVEEFVSGGDGMSFACQDDDSPSPVTVQNADSTNIDVISIHTDSDDTVSQLQSDDQNQNQDNECAASVPCSDASNVPVSSYSSLLAPTDTSTHSSRPMCAYRDKCYRTNAQHKRDFSHPNDADYDGQLESDSTSSNPEISKPQCWYGKNCYRKNEEHQRKFSHSSSRTRKRNATQTRRENSNESEDPDEYDDSFIDDDDLSDDYMGISGEETDKGFSDFDDYSSSDDDCTDGHGRTKKKKFSIL